jgi:2,4-dienoyl-CoA reductase-like NADH-dependent reductase (Old Yellow Enzyme family)
MSKPFDSGTINGMAVANRFVRSATWEGMATAAGEVTPRLVALMTDLARGAVGLIITGHAYVRRDGQAGPWQLGVYSDELISGLEAMARAVHQNDGRIVLQLAHAGVFADHRRTGLTPWAVSADSSFAKNPRRELAVSDIGDLVQSFVDAAQRAQRAGFDGVQIHAAHGYLFSEFLSPAFNYRMDAYGGPIQNRARALIEVVQGIRKATAADYPILVKMNCRDFLDNGLTLEDSLAAAFLLAEAGLDAIELSGGMRASGKLMPGRVGINTPEKEAYFREEARAFKSKVALPLILVGGIRSLEVAEALLKNGVADYVSMSRPLIREPGLIRRWRSGDCRRAECESDNLCFGPILKGEGVYCVPARQAGSSGSKI